jgi:hypothetical protein
LPQTTIQDYFTWQTLGTLGVASAAVMIVTNCLADEPVQGEPVSEARFPANREKNREFRENRAVWQKAARQNVAESAC